MTLRKIKRQQAKALLKEINNKRKEISIGENWDCLVMKLGEAEADILTEALTLYVRLLEDK